MRCEFPGMKYEALCERLEQLGGVVEERIAGEESRSPSVQLRVTPLGKVELRSTHDQLLGGSGGQSYVGCRFPADPAYAPMITSEAKKVWTRLAKEGSSAASRSISWSCVPTRKPGSLTPSR